MQVSLDDLVAAVHRQAALVSFPTDTVMALASHPEQGAAIYAAKGRSRHKPLILMAAHLTDLLPYVVGTPTEIALWRRITDHYWPGPLTLVLPASPRVPAAINPDATGTIGIRVPNHSLARYLLARTGPLATTSANRSGCPPVQSQAELMAQFPAVLSLADAALAAIQAEIGHQPPPAIASVGRPSTVVRWTGQGWDLLRPGAIAVEGDLWNLP